MSTSGQGWIPVSVCGCCDSEDAARVGQVRGLDVLRCVSCSTIRVAAVMSPEAVYSGGYHTGETWMEGDKPFDYTAPENVEYEMHNCRRRLRWLERFTPPGRLLDVGGGVGTFALVAKERGWDPTVLEPVRDAVDYVRGLGLKGIVGRIEDLREGDGSYDVLSMVHVLEHFPEARNALERARSILRPGALLFLEVPHYGSVPRRVSGEEWIGWRPGQHVHLFTKPTLHALLVRAGLEVLRIRSIVLHWDGLILDYYAYLVGAQPLLRRMVEWRRRLRGRTPSSGKEEAEGIPPPLREQRFRRTLLGLPLFLAAKAEERLGVGENLVAVARVPGR